MKRVLTCAMSACLVFGSFGLTGCDSGGIPEGAPEKIEHDIPLDKMKDMADMTKGPKMPKDGPKPDATPPAPDATKK